LILQKNEIISKGFTSVFHLNTIEEECTIEEIRTISFINEKGELI